MPDEPDVIHVYRLTVVRSIVEEATIEIPWTPKGTPENMRLAAATWADATGAWGPSHVELSTRELKRYDKKTSIADLANGPSEDLPS